MQMAGEDLHQVACQPASLTRVLILPLPASPIALCLLPVSCQALILDEAHRLKSRTSATRAALLELPVHWWLLLSGTPVQNNMRELQVGTACHTLQLLFGRMVGPPPSCRAANQQAHSVHACLGHVSDTVLACGPRDILQQAALLGGLHAAW